MTSLASPTQAAFRGRRGRCEVPSRRSAGLLLHRHARRILDDVGEAEDTIAGLVGSPRGELRISVPFTVAAGPLAQMLSGFLERYPEVRGVLAVDNQSVDLLVEEIDIAIRIGPLPGSLLIARRLTTFALWPCATPAYPDFQASGAPAEGTLVRVLPKSRAAAWTCTRSIPAIAVCLQRSASSSTPWPRPSRPRVKSAAVVALRSSSPRPRQRALWKRTPTLLRPAGPRAVRSSSAHPACPLRRAWPAPPGGAGAGRGCRRSRCSGARARRFDPRA